MNIMGALRAMARAFPGKVAGLALHLHKAESTLDKELRATGNFKLGVEDAVEITVACHDAGLPEAREFVTALAARLDCLVLPMPAASGVCDDQCLQAVAVASREMHELMTEVMQALADGRVCDNERVRVERGAADLVSAVQALLQLMASRNEAGKPSWVRAA